MNTEYVPAKIVIGAYEFLSEEYNIDSISITTGSYDGNVVGIGSAYSPSCRVTMDNVDAIDVGVVFSVYFQKNGAWENYGKFVITEEPDVYNREKMSFAGEGYIYSIMSKQYKGVPGIGYNIELGTEIQYELFIKKFQSEFGFELIFSDSIKNELCTRHPINILLPQEKTDTTLYTWEFIKISWREWLQGIAILFGANVIEKNGKIYITELENSFSEKETIQISSSDCAELKLSRKDYTINGTKIKYQKTNDLDKPWDDEDIYNWDVNGPNVGISGTGEASITYNLSFVENAIAYQYEIFCSWLRGTILYFNAKRIIEKDIYDEGNELDPKNIAYFPEEAYLPNELIKANNVVYRPGVIEYSGIVDGIEAGKVISIKNEDGTSYKFYVGEMTLEWDGGFKTILSCNSPANNSSSSASSSISGGINVQTPASSSYASLIQGLLGHVSLNFADITFSNIKNSTISGSKFIDGSIDGSKINFSTFKDGVISGTAIDTSTFKDGSISGSSFVDGTIENSKIKDSTLTGAKIADATIGIEKVNESFISDLTAKNAFISNLTATVAKINSLTATDAIIRNIFSNKIVSDKAILDVLQANIINAEYIKTAVADVGYITADEADLSYADITLGNIDTANIDVAKIGLLFTQVGLIDRATIVDGHITGFLDAVEINADKITAGTLIADRILLKGSESGLLYALNNLGELTSTAVDTLDGTILTQRTVTADKLVANSITANELDAEDIFANSAVIKKISTGVADIIELDADRIKSGIIDSARINTAEILASHAQFGKDYVTVDVNNESTMFTPDNIHIYNEIGGTDIQGGYIVNTNSSRKNIVPFCNYTSNDLIPGDVISVTVTYKYDIQNARDGVKAFAYFFNSDGTINAYGKIESSKIIGSSGTEKTDTFYITIPKEIVKFEFKNGYVDYAYVVFGIVNEYTGATMYVKSASAIKVSDSIRVIGTSKMDDLVVDNLTIEKELSLGHLRLTSWLEVDAFSSFHDTVSVKSPSSSYGTYIYPSGGIFVRPSSYTTEQTKINSSGIETGGYVKANTITSKASVSAQSIELSFSTPYIDFHFENSTSDYTSRIIEEASGRLKVTGSLSIGDKLIGGKWCHNDTTSYGLYWSSESVLRPISSSYKVSLGSSSCPMSSIYATTLYEGGKLLKNKYAVVKTSTGSKKGTGGWTGITINFGVTFTTIPMFNAMFTNGFTTENISVTDISTTSATIWICALDKSFTYQYRWFAVGNIA